jgi:hypothetical protein
MLALCAALWAGAHAAAAPADRLEACIKLYQAGDFVSVVDSLSALMPFINDARQDIRAYQYLAFSYAMLKMRSTAKRLFTAALARHPCMRVDTLMFPPQLTEIFYEAKVERDAALALTAKQRDKGEKTNLFIRKTLGTVLLATGVCGSMGGGWYLGDASAQFEAQHISTARLSLWTGVAIGVTSVAVVPLGLYLLVKGEHGTSGKKRVCVRPAATGVGAEIAVAF